jgi:hypothetical protein
MAFRHQWAPVAAALHALAEAVAQLDNDTDGHAWIDQASSPLGPRRHCAAVRRRIGQGMDGAAIVGGRRHLLSGEALADEMANGTTSNLAKPSVIAELERKLRLVGGRTLERR